MKLVESAKSLERTMYGIDFEDVSGGLIKIAVVQIDLKNIYVIIVTPHSKL